MKENIIKHRIQKHVIDVLSGVEFARFRDLRPKHTDTNLLTYHIKLLLDRDLIGRNKSGYYITQKGVSAHKVLTKKIVNTAVPSDILIMFVVQNSNGDLLLQKRLEHPYLNAWSLPSNIVLATDKNLKHSASRIAKQRLGITDKELSHAGQANIRISSKSGSLPTMVHVFKFDSDDIKTNDIIIWARPHKLDNYKLVPGVDNIVARTFFNDPFFFEEFEETWQNS